MRTLLGFLDDKVYMIPNLLVHVLTSRLDCQVREPSPQLEISVFSLLLSNRWRSSANTKKRLNRCQFMR